jgi:Cu(I)/Ag(I) efflux system membrane fusion protein
MRRLIVIRRFSRRQAIVVALALAIVVAALAAWLFIAPGTNQSESACPGGQPPAYWYDPMVPGEHYPGPGKSSMNMALQPKCASAGAQEGVTISPAMQQNLGIRLAKVEVREIAPQVRAVGHVQFDERLIRDVQTLTPGFVETLSVRAEGEPIAAGRVIATVYSPDLLTAENEYKVLLTSHSPAAISLRPAARERLRLLGMPESLVRRLEHGGAPQRTYPVIARESGVVTKIGSRPGAQVALGESIVTIQGLSRVLVVADVPEAMLGSVHVGQPAEISFPAYAGQPVRGVVDYIFPSLNTQTRTAQLRITLPNPGGRLRQGMFANVTLQGTGGTALVVPSEAVIDTGVRQVVIVKRGKSFIPQEVKVGRDEDQYTEILAGLQPGEEVVASGQFLIDSEASLQGFLSRLQNTQPGTGR